MPSSTDEGLGFPETDRVSEDALNRFGAPWKLPDGASPTPPGPASMVIPLPPHSDPLDLTMRLLEHLVQRYGAVVTEVDVRRMRDASFTLRVPAPSAAATPAD
jgi:hypothetical protein